VTPDDLAALRDQLDDHEGRSLHLYKDITGHWSIGVGRNLSDRGIFDDECDLMLDNDIAWHEGALFARIPWAAQVDVVRQRVLIDMCFNLGPDGLVQFHRMLDALRRGDHESAAAEMLASRWSGQVGRRAQRLARMMRTGLDG